MPKDVLIADPLGPQSSRDARVPVRAGDVLAGKYRVETVLGVGGMGVVVAATHVHLGQKVALKFMLPEAMKDKDMSERFIREARNAVRLKGEHVAHVLDVGTLDTGAPYMVMEFLEGSDLRVLAKAGGSLPVRDVITYIMQAAEALAEAHALGIVHRDIKPHNLFLTKKANGRPSVKVLDFGISKTLDEQIGGDSSLTRTSAVMGSPHYMAPEQMRSARDVDARADVWALGVCLYQLLTGHVPFEAESLLELGGKVLHEPPVPVTNYRQDLAPELVTIVMRCLEKGPTERFKDGGDLASALEQHLMGISALSWAGAHAIAPAALSAPAMITAGQTGNVPAQSYGGGGTGVSWGQTAGALASRRSVVMVAAGSFLCVLMLVVGIFRAIRNPSPSPSAVAAAPPSSAVPIAAAPTGAFPPAAQPSAPLVPSPAAPSTGSAAAPPSPSTPPVVKAVVQPQPARTTAATHPHHKPAANPSGSAFDHL